jgi:hypothetical protein
MRLALAVRLSHSPPAFASAALQESPPRERDPRAARKWIDAFKLSINCDPMAGCARTSSTAAMALCASRANTAKNASYLPAGASCFCFTTSLHLHSRPRIACTTRVKKLAAWRDASYPAAAASLLEGLEECFTISRLDLPHALHRCLATTNIIEGPHAGVRIQTRRVTHWQNRKMVQRWMAAAFLRTEKRFKRIMGHRDLWGVEEILSQSTAAGQKAA